MEIVHGPIQSHHHYIYYILFGYYYYNVILIRCFGALTSVVKKLFYICVCVRIILDARKRFVARCVHSTHKPTTQTHAHLLNAKVKRKWYKKEKKNVLAMSNSKYISVYFRCAFFRFFCQPFCILVQRFMQFIFLLEYVVFTVRAFVNNLCLS